MSSKTLRRSGPLAAAIALAVSGSALADGTVRPKETPEEDVVTAQKRVERLIDMPISMSAIAKYTSDVAGSNVDDGDSIIDGPKTPFAVSGLYRWPISAGLNGFARAEVQHTSPRSGTILGVPDSEAITVVNARFGIETGAWDGYFGVARLRPRTLGLHVSDQQA